MNEVISIKGVFKSFNDVAAVRGIDLSIQKGDFVALLGPNGAGKTTLMEMIEGIQVPDSGHITINGKSWKGNENALHHVIGISLQETLFIDKLTVLETLMLFASFYEKDAARCKEIMKLIRLEEKSKALVKNLSGGQRQRLALGIALINNPEVLLLDEPTTGLDPTARREIWDILIHLKLEHQMTMILTTHYMEEAAYLCQRILIMDQGKILAEGTLEELLFKSNCAEIIEFSLEAANTRFDIPLNDSNAKLIRDEKNNKWRIEIDNIVSYLPSFLDGMKKQGKQIKTLECRKSTLDDLFISMTGRRLNE